MTENTAVSRAGEQRPTAKEPISTGGPVGALVPQNIDQAFRLSQALAMSGDMVPKHFQGEPQKIMAAIMRGMEVGLAPMQALAHIAVINGRATVWGDALPALVQRAGHSVDVRLEGEGDNLAAVATLTRGDTGKAIERRFSMADAKRANLASKPGPWQQYPTRMLSHRARAWAIRDGAADALMGLDVAEEVSDYGPDRARDVTPRRGGVIYREIEPPAAEPPADYILEAGEVEIDTGPTEEERAAAIAAVEAQMRAEREAEEAGQ